MKREVRWLLWSAIALAVVIFMAGTFAKPVWAANYVTGGATREKAKEIVCNESYIMPLKGKKEVFFKFTTPAGDYTRYNTWLRVESNSSYDGKFFAFFGSVERMDNENHAKWANTAYGRDFPLLFCKPSTTYYLWICGGDAKCEGYLNFSVMGDEDDADDYKSAPATPVSVGKKAEASIDTRKEGKLTDQDWFSFTTGDGEVYGITVKQGTVESSNDTYEKFGLYVSLYEENEHEKSWLFRVDYNTKNSKNFRLKSNTKYLLQIQPYDFVTRKGKNEDDDWDGYPSMYSPYSFRIDTSKLKPWEVEEDPPTSLALSKTLETCVESPYDGAVVNWYTFTTKNAGNYKITIAREPIPWDADTAEESDLATIIYDSNAKELGSFIVEEEKTGKYILSLKANTKYILKIYPTNFAGDIFPEYLYDDPDSTPYALAQFKLRVNPVKDKTLDKATVTYKKKWTYDGKAVTPAVKVVYNGKTLTKGTDYKVSYANNTMPGKASIKVTGKGSYGNVGNSPST